jgi:hypothetical protein
MRTSPTWARDLTRAWYRWDLPVMEIARALGIKQRSSIYSVRNAALAYYLGAFAGRGLRLRPM